LEEPQEVGLPVSVTLLVVGGTHHLVHQRQAPLDQLPHLELPQWAAPLATPPVRNEDGTRHPRCLERAVTHLEVVSVPWAPREPQARPEPLAR
jgi:hypothetical protein